MNVASPEPQMKRNWLDWPFFGESHRAFAGALDRFVVSDAASACAKSALCAFAGATEVQKLIAARELLKARPA